VNNATTAIKDKQDQQTSQQKQIAQRSFGYMANFGILPVITQPFKQLDS
jgi:hypothetical protein